MTQTIELEKMGLCLLAEQEFIQITGGNWVIKLGKYVVEAIVGSVVGEMIGEGNESMRGGYSQNYRTYRGMP